MPILDARHDDMHAVEEDSAWSESYNFNAYDPDADAGFFTRIGVRPNEGTIDVMLACWLPGDRVAFLRAKREQTTMCGPPLEVGGVRYACLERGRRWHIEAQAEARLFDLARRHETSAPIGLDVAFEALIPMIGHDGERPAGAGPSAPADEVDGSASASARRATGKGHFEQAGRWTGAIVCGGERFVLGARARGNRDKSWGPRRWDAPKMWRWFSINVADDYHLGGIRIGTDGGDLHRGWVWRDGEHTSLAEWRLRTETAGDGITQKTCHVTAVDKRGREHVLRGDVMRVFPGGARPDETVVNEGLTAWTCDGVTGYGIAEYLHQFDAQSRPLVPIE